jgi:hypothetical protein
MCAWSSLGAPQIGSYGRLVEPPTLGVFLRAQSSAHDRVEAA